MRKALVLLFMMAVIGSAQAQQRAYRCPEMTPEARRASVAKMMGWAEKGRLNGCRARPDGPLDLDCELSMDFVGTLNNPVPYYGMPWTSLVACFPELGRVKAVNAEAKAQQEDLQIKKDRESRVANEQEQARNNDPQHLLTRTYYDYITIKRCYEQRDGYLAVNISGQEMERAKKAAKGIEGAIQKKKPDIDKDAAWTAANSGSDDWKTETDKVELTLLGQYNSRLEFDRSDRSRCQNALETLEKRSSQISPEAEIMKKDF